MKNKSTDNINISSTQSNTNNEMNNTIFDSKNGNTTNDNRISAEFGTKGNNLIGKKKEIIFKIKKNVREDNLIYRFKIQFYQNFIISIANKIIGIKENIEERFLKISKNVMENQNVEPNLTLLKNSIKNFFSLGISSKKLDKKHNEKLSNEYIKKNDIFKKFSEKKVDDLYKIFIAKDCESQLKNEFGIEYKLSLNSIIKEMEENGKINLYKIKKIKEIWSNIYNFFDINKKHIKKNKNFKLFKIKGKPREQRIKKSLRRHYKRNKNRIHFKK